METSNTNLPNRLLAPQVHLLTAAAELGRRIRGEALEHYVHAVMRTIDDCLTHLPETAGMDFRAAVAIMPQGQPLVEVEFQPALLPPAAIDDIKRRIESLPRPPVREGPVALLAFWLVKDGSNDLRNSFRQPLGPSFRVECPNRFAAALNDAEAAARGGPGAVEARSGRHMLMVGKVRFSMASLALRASMALRRVWSALFSRAAPSASGPSAKKAAKAKCHLHEGPCELPEGLHSLDEITEQIRLCPQCGKLYGRRARLYSGQGQFDLAIADYTRQIDLGTEVPQAHLARGICYRMTGKQEKALEDFHEAVWRKPRWAEAIVARAWTYYALGKTDRALDDATLAVDLDPDEANWRLARARLLAAGGKFAEALADIDCALALDPHHCDGLFLRASVYRDRPCAAEQAKADFQASLADFTTVLHLHPGHAESYASRASIRMRLEDAAGAEADCTKAIQLDPKCILAYRVRGKIRQQQGNLDEAIDDFSTGIRLAPADAVGYACRAEAYAAQNKLEEVAADCSRAIEIDARYAPAFALRGLTHFQLDHYDQAFADCSEAIRLGLEFPNLYLCRANIHFLENRLVQAMLDCNQALRVAPGHVDALSARGMVRTRLGLFREALSDFNQAVRQAPEAPLLYLHRGNAYGTLEDHQAALDDFSEAIRLNPDFAIAYYSRAVAWLHLGENPRAIEDCDAAIRGDADCAPAHFLRAKLLDQLGVADEAIASYNDAIRLAPDFAAAYAGRANAWISTGDYDQAISDYRQAIHREPAAGQMLGQLEEEYAVEAVVRGLAEAEPGRGNLFLAGFLARSHSLDEALDQCETAMEHLPAEEVLGVALQVLRERIDEAEPEMFQRIETWFQRATGPEGRSFGLEFLLAYFRELEGRDAELCEIFRRLIERPDLAPGQRALACNNMAYYLAVHEDDIPHALELADRAIELSGPYPEYLDTRGVALLAAGRFDEAVAELRRAVGNKPTGLRLYHLARACHFAGDDESAEEAWNEAHREHELTLQQIPPYEQDQYRAFAETLGKSE